MNQAADIDFAAPMLFRPPLHKLERPQRRKSGEADRWPSSALTEPGAYYPRPPTSLLGTTAAASRWRVHMRSLGYRHAYADLFMQLLAEGWLSRLDGRTAVRDCGIGTAVLGAALAGALPALRWVAGVDVSPGMLARAAVAPHAAGVAADLRRADARQLPFPDDGHVCLTDERG